VIEVVDAALMGLAFSAGVIAFFNPCSYALLPSYISYYLGKGSKKEKAESPLRKGLKGAGVGAMATLGFLSVFVIIGALISLVSSEIGLYLPWLTAGVGVVFIILGALWLTGAPLSFPHALKISIGHTHLSFYFFGIAYALGSAACVLPIFLMVTLSALTTGGFLSGLLIFVSYALGMGIMMVGVAVAVALSEDMLLRHLPVMMKYVRKAGALILIAAGIYLIYFWYTTFGV